MTEFTIPQLSKFDGNGPDGKIYVAVNRQVFDVTEKGKAFYGKGGPYSMFAGRDASLALATMRTELNTTGKPDDLSGLRPIQQKCLESWEGTFKEKYQLVGTLID